MDLVELTGSLYACAPNVSLIGERFKLVVCKALKYRER